MKGGILQQNHFQPKTRCENRCRKNFKHAEMSASVPPPATRRSRALQHDSKIPIERITHNPLLTVTIAAENGKQPETKDHDQMKDVAENMQATATQWILITKSFQSPYMFTGKKGRFEKKRRIECCPQGAGSNIYVRAERARRRCFEGGRNSGEDGLQ